MTYPIHLRTTFLGSSNWEKPSNTLLGRTTSFCTDVYRLLSNNRSSSSSSMTPWGKQSNSWTPWLFFLDQGFPVECGLDTFNTPHRGTTLRNPPKMAMFTAMSNSAPALHLWATFSGDMHASPRITRTTKSRWLQCLFPQTANMTFATYGEHNPSHVQRHALFSPLSHNSISSLYFFLFPRGLQHKCKLNIPCCH